MVVSGGHARHGLLTVARLEMIFSGDEQAGLRIELQEGYAGKRLATRLPNHLLYIGLSRLILFYRRICGLSRV